MKREPTSRRRNELQRKPPATALAVTYRPLSSLTLDPKNPRKHSDRQIDQLARSISAFGFNVPILVGVDGVILAGHGRAMAAERLGLRDVPTISVEHLTASQQRAFVIADNALAAKSEWDMTLLGEQFALLLNEDLTFDITVTGFDVAEIDLAVQHLGSTSPGPDADDEPLALQPVVTQPGDVWNLGSHTVLCGDALDPRSYAALMGNTQAAVVFTDPPFNVKVSSISGKRKRKHREFAMASGEMSRREFSDFLRRAFELMADHSRDGSIHFVCMDFRHMTELLAAGEAVYDKFKNLVVWVKSNGGMGSLYRSRHELIFVFKSGTAARQNHVELGRYGRNRSNAWEYPVDLRARFSHTFVDR